ncbi:MAG: hypothetical protein ACOCNX_00945 [Prevotella sp.]
MEENKKVFIRGRKGREQEVIDILTELGANAPKYELADSNDYIYFINHGNEISAKLIDSEVGRIVMDNYKEIELPQRPWKDGDILAFDFDSGSYCSGVYAVFKNYTGNDTFESYILVNDDDVRLGISCPTGAYRLANEVEKEDFRRRYSFVMSDLKAASAVLNKDAE